MHIISKNKHFKNAIFLFAVVFLCLPIPLLNYFENKLQNVVYNDVLFDNWELVDTSSNKIVQSNLKLPFDKLDFNKNNFLLKKKLNLSFLNAYKRPTFVVGRIADSDRIKLNHCIIGSTGIDADNKMRGWWWLSLRSYEIPNQCINIKNESVLEIEIYKWAGPLKGVVLGPIGFGEYDQISSLVRVNEFLRFDVLTIYGAVCIVGIFFYYLFLFSLIPSRKDNFIFSLSAFFVGVFEIITGAMPYRYLNNSLRIMKINFIVPAIASTLIVYFISIKIRDKSKFLVKTYAVGSVLFLIFGLSSARHEIVSKIYDTWFLWLLIFFTSLYYKYFKYEIQKSVAVDWKYFFGFSIFMISCFLDIFLTLTSIPNQYYIPFGFMIFFTAISFGLAQESADAFLNVEIKVDERTRDLAKAMEELKSLDQYKERFFANISHDFKTPITVAMGAVEQLRNMVQDAGQSKMIVAANRSLNQLLNMVGDILNLAKAKSGQLKLQWQSAPIAKLLESWLEPQEVLCKQKGITLEYDFSSYAPLHIPMDVKNMERVIQNLMSNAIKFTQAKKDGLKKIKVELLTDGSKMSLIISDSGIGIPDDEKTKVFERFVQSSRTDAKEHGGTGIGLSFVKEIIDLHLGKILVKDSEFGGTTIVLEIPLTQNQELLETYSLEEKSKINLTGSLDVTYPPSNPSVKKEGLRSVLIAEDNPEVAQIIYSSLQDQYNVYFARDGQEALERLQNENFDCLLSDINMPRMQGDQLLGEVRKMPKKRNMPIVMLSSKGDDETVVELLNKGANDFVSKPFKKEVLIARIKTQIEGYYISRWIAKNERLIEMGMLASGMAHQIKNGLNNIRNQINYVFRSAISMIENAQRKGESVDLNTKERIEVSAEHARRGLDRIQNLTESISAYTSGSRQKVSISIKDSIKLVQTLQADEITKTNMNIIVDPSVENLKVMGYATVHEVFMNVITNALDACKNISNPQILIKGHETENHVVVLIKDNGHGIEPVVLENLCQPFYTTKAPGEGTGLGLYLVRDFVEVQHAGEFKIESDGKDKGTEITIKLAKIAPDPVRESKMTMHNVSV